MFRPLVRVLKYATIFAVFYLVYLACFDLASNLFSKSEPENKSEFEEKLDKIIGRIDLAVKNTQEVQSSAEDLEKIVQNPNIRSKLIEKPPSRPDFNDFNPKIKNVNLDHGMPGNNQLVNEEEAQNQQTPEILPEVNPSDFHHILPEVQNKLKNSIIPVLVIACNRETVSQALDKLIISRKSVQNDVLKIPIVVSQDNCNHPGTTKVIEKYVKNYPDIHFIQHKNETDPAPELNVRSKKWQIGYYKLSRHYKFALDQAFYKIFPGVNIDATIIVEDDLEVSPDFFSYMLAGYEHMLVEEANGHNDQFLCVSAWNDNGKPQNVDNSDAGLMKAHLTDFFPGLGWLIRKHVWEEFRTVWPKAYWDDWVRLPDQRKNRACIQPEISRSHTFGKKGVSNGQFFEKHLKYIKLADITDVGVNEWRQALKPLVDKPVYDKTLASVLGATEKISQFELNKRCNGKPTGVSKNLSVRELALLDPNYSYFRIEYNSENEFKSAAKTLGLMTDSKSGVPRTAYMGVIESQHQNCRVFITPPISKLGVGFKYDTTWKGKP